MFTFAWFGAFWCGKSDSRAGETGARSAFVPLFMMPRFIVAENAGGASVRTNIDRRALLDGLSLGGNAEPALVREVIGLFLADAPKLLELLRDGLSTGDHKSMLRAVHTLKSSAAMVAAVELAAVAASAEAHARGARIDEVEKLLPQLDALLAGALRELSVIGVELDSASGETEKQ